MATDKPGLGSKLWHQDNQNNNAYPRQSQSMLYKRWTTQSNALSSDAKPDYVDAYVDTDRMSTSRRGSGSSNTTSHGGADNSLTASTISLVAHQQERRELHQQQRRQAGIVAVKPAMIGRQLQHFGLAQIKPKLLLPNAPRKHFQFAHHKRNRNVGLTPASVTATATTTVTTAITDMSNRKSSSYPNKHAQFSDTNETTNINKPRDVRWLRRPPLWQQQQLLREQQANASSIHQKSEKSKRPTEGIFKLFARTGNFPLKVKAFMIEFLQGSSIHGFVYLAKIGLNFVERMLWFAFICVAVFSIISLSKRTWQRFQTSPMVISMDRNKLVWNTSFPSLTVCPHKRIDELKVDEYMLDNPDYFVTEEDKENFRDFIVKLASLSYDNLETLPLNNSFGIPSSKYLEILYELKWHFEPEISSGAAVKMFIYETQTEFGICHSVNSVVARYNSYDYWRRNDWSILEHGDRVTVHPLDGEIYAQIINLSTAYDVYFHGAGDVPSISKQRYTFPESDYTTVELIALEIYTNEEAKGFTTKQRKCRFQYEAEDMWSVPIYSFGLCLSECRMFFALKVCGCVPHFYRNKLRNGRVLPICGLEGIGCLVDIKREIISLKSDRYKIDCNCLANCDDSNFFVQSYRSRVWFLGANLQWGIVDYPKMQLRRDVLFSFADVLVYIGGLVGFFLGCSALSFTEIVYYFTCRLVKRMFFS